MRQTHELTLIELAEARDSEEKYRKLNDALVEGM